MLANHVRDFMDALRAMALEQSEANAERVADALDAILLRAEAPPASQSEPEAEPAAQLDEATVQQDAK